MELHRKRKRQQEASYRCRDKCYGDNEAQCAAKRLKECSICQRILLSQCNKCKSPGGRKAKMILPASATCRLSTSSSKKKARRQIRVKEEIPSSDDNTDAEVDGDDVDIQPEIDEGVQSGANCNVKEISSGDYVQITKGMFLGYYASLIEEGYADELEIQYFAEKEGKPHGRYWVLMEHDYDSRPKCDLKKVEPQIDWRGHLLKK